MCTKPCPTIETLNKTMASLMYGCCFFGFGCVVTHETLTLCASTLALPAHQTMPDPNGGTNWWTHLPGISRFSHTHWKSLLYDSFMAHLGRCVVGAPHFPKKRGGRTITRTITKRYSKLTRRCLGPPLTQLLALEAYFTMLACLLA